MDARRANNRIGWRLRTNWARLIFWRNIREYKRRRRRKRLSVCVLYILRWKKGKNLFGRVLKQPRESWGMCVDGNPPGRHMHKLETTTRRLLFYIISSSCASFGMKGEEEEEDMPSRHFTCKVNKISFHLSPPPTTPPSFSPPSH
jgi:hypothetical protein